MSEDVMLHHGDCRTVLARLPERSVDAIVTDPPAGIAFMSATWDNPWEYGVGGAGAPNPGARHQVAISSSRNPMCRKCHQQRRGRHADRGRGDEACHCPVPDFDDADRTRRARERFVAAMTAIFTECRRVLKPGGFAFVWGLPRTSHWTATALEDAGFEIRDVLTHLFGQGFPKSLDVSKALDKAAGARREVVGHDDSRSHYDGCVRRPTLKIGNAYAQDTYSKAMCSESAVTAPATDLARQWDGWGTALKPAAEHWILARAPLSEPTVAANVAKWGTGALNIGATRIGTAADLVHSNRVGHSGKDSPVNVFGPTRMHAEPSGQGRWPANVVLSHTLFCTPAGTRRVKSGVAHRTHGGGKTFGGDAPKPPLADMTYAAPDGTETVEAWDCAPDCPVALLDAQAGPQRSGGTPPRRFSDKTRYAYGKYTGEENPNGIGASAGNVSRFFYCAKASPAERSAGLPAGERNAHPTVKPVALCRWLIRLVTPPGGVVCDPFMGSGSVGVAARAEGMAYIGIEQEAAYVETAMYRIGVTA